MYLLRRRNVCNTLASPKSAFLSLFLGLLILPTTSHAVLTDNLGVVNAKALALAHAVTADPPGIDSIHYNPAGLIRIKGRRRQIQAVTGSFDITLELGEYNDKQQGLLDLAHEFYESVEFPTSLMPTDEYYYDEAYNATSKTAGPSIMVPGVGQTDLGFILMPMGGASYSPPGGNITFATNAYAPMAAGFYREDDDPGRFIGQRFSLSLITYFSPSIAVQVNDELSIGASINFNYAGVGIELPFRAPYDSILTIPALQNGFSCDEVDINGEADPLVNICNPLPLYDVLGTLSFEVDKNLTFGFNLGFLWEPTPWVAFGFVYQSPVKMDMEGDFQWVNSNAWNTFIGDLLEDPQAGGVVSFLGVSGTDTVEGKASLDMEFPEHYSFGVSLQLTPNLQINVDYKFTAWSSWQTIPVQFSESIDFVTFASYVQPELSTPTSVTFPLGLVDTWNFAIGFEYRWNDRLDLRFGLEDRPSSVPKESRSALLPIDSGIFYGMGIGYKMDSGAILDLGLGYFHSEVEMPGGSSKFTNSNDGSLLIYNPYVGQDVSATLDVILVQMSYSSEF
ncbi:hypothetical protein A9Q99_19435 [Gammaproteobacteria bacterium 45_16_T64]|nr:hypothetical protein A9Q99_19435 [Gammaproteobacteria bacterium 45_16_T64]